MPWSTICTIKLSNNSISTHAVASTGEFFVADGYCNSRIIKYNAAGRILRVIPQPPGIFIVMNCKNGSHSFLFRISLATSSTWANTIGTFGYSMYCRQGKYASCMPKVRAFYFRIRFPTTTQIIVQLQGWTEELKRWGNTSGYNSRTRFGSSFRCSRIWRFCIRSKWSNITNASSPRIHHWSANRVDCRPLGRICESSFDRILSKWFGNVCYRDRSQ